MSSMRGKLTVEDNVDGVTSESDPRPEHNVKKGAKRRAASSPSSEKSRAKKAVEVACWPCRKRKAKCSGERPSCGPCVQRGVGCAYEFQEGLTKLSWMKMRLDEATVKADDLEFLFEQLRVRSDQESSMLLAIVRLGADFEKIVAQLRADPQALFSNEASLNISQFMTDPVEPGSHGDAGPSGRRVPKSVNPLDPGSPMTGPDHALGASKTI